MAALRMSQGTAALDPAIMRQQRARAALAAQPSSARSFIAFGDAAEAYRASFAASEMKPETVWSEASLLLSNRKVSVRIGELRRDVAASARITLVEHLHELERLKAANARYAGACGHLRKALTGRGVR